MIKTICFLLAIHAFAEATAQTDTGSELFTTLKTNDSLLFDVGFNTCDLNQFENLVSDNFEFYHDQGGVTASKSGFINSIKDGICKMDYRPRRELVPGSLEVYPLSKNGVLYGAIQVGVHRFYSIKNNEPEQRTSIAKFTHVWLIEEGAWKLTRVLSYDHQN